MENFLFTPNKCINENLEKDHYSSCPNTTHHNNNNNTNSEQVQHNGTSESDKSADLMSISSFLQSSIITHPIIHFGWLNKYSRRGFQPRLVFLFTDRLIYTSRIRGVTGLYLKVRLILFFLFSLISLVFIVDKFENVRFWINGLKNNNVTNKQSIIKQPEP